MTAYYISSSVVLLLVGGLTWWMPSLMQPTLPFGVRVPPERAADPAIGRVTRAYRRETVAATVAVAIATAALTGWLGWLIVPGLAAGALALAGMAIYYRAHRELAARKAREGWYAGQPEALVAGVSPDRRSVRPLLPWLAPALAIIALTALIGVIRYPDLPDRIATHYGADGTADRWARTTPVTAFALVAGQLAMTAIIVGLLWLAGRARQDLDPAQPETSAERAAAFYALIGRGLFLLAAAVNLALLFGSLVIWGVIAPHGVAQLLLTGPVLLGLLALVVVTRRVGQGGSRLRTRRAEAPTGYVARDDDRFWRGGMFYFNRADPALLVPKRFGVGWTFNFARPAAWAVIVAILALATLPGLLAALGR